MSTEPTGPDAGPTPEVGQSLLDVENLHVTVDGAPILRGVDLSVRTGSVHALMGPNGSGKSTLAYSIAGHPKYTLDSGEVLLDGENIVSMT
ncbi:MAG: ATP-binding cassette domain-containing protein, partial [Acidimicrobiales bacterium]